MQSKQKSEGYLQSKIRQVLIMLMYVLLAVFVFVFILHFIRDKMQFKGNISYLNDKIPEQTQDSRPMKTKKKKFNNNAEKYSIENIFSI